MYDYDEDEDRGFFQKHRGLVLVGVLLVLGGAIFGAYKIFTKNSSSSSRSEMTMVRLPPPPPPPPPRLQPTPPKEQPTPEQQEQKMVEQVPVENQQKPEPPKEAPPSLGTTITGNGPGMGGLSYGSGNGFGIGNGHGTGTGGSKYGFYASEVQNKIAEAVRTNPKTRHAQMTVVVRIWVDSTGRVTKARVPSSGDPNVDKALQDEVLNGLQLPEPPPSDMPMPIVMRLSARRPQ